MESAHRVHIVVADAGGDVLHQAGDADLLTFLRSAAKPFQAAALVATGAVDHYALSDAELAVAAGSHMGEASHVAAVASLLAKAGLTEGALRCGTHAPRSVHAKADALCHNCSGKHAGMLLLQRHLGGDPATYLDPASPAQAAVRAAVQDAGPGVEAAWAVDGCGAPTPAMPLRAAARAFARLAQGKGHLGRIRDAMARHPELVGGTGSYDSDLMGAADDRVVSKLGAEGAQGVGDLATGTGLFLKVEDGAKRAVAPASVEALRQLAWLEGRAFEVLGEWWRPVLRNDAGLAVGEVRPVVPLVTGP